MDLESSHEFLGSEERVISSLESDTFGLFVTNWRLISLKKTEDGESRTFQDFDFKYISHVHCESTIGKDSRFLGICAIVLGLIIIAIGYNSYGWRGISLILGILILIVGIIFILKKIEYRSVLNIDIVGIANPITFSLTTTASQMDRILRYLAEMREKTTLRHDQITLSKEATN